MKILIAHEQYRSMKNFLLKSGYDVVGATVNGVRALRIIEKEEIDLVISDVSLTHMGGIDFIRNAYDLLPQSKILILSHISERGNDFREIDCKGKVLKREYYSSIDDFLTIVEKLQIKK